MTLWQKHYVPNKLQIMQKNIHSSTIGYGIVKQQPSLLAPFSHPLKMGLTSVFIHEDVKGLVYNKASGIKDVTGKV